MALVAFDVYLDGKRIDTVFYSAPTDPDDVRRSLIGHDGYDSRIEVRKSRRRKPPMPRPPAPTRAEIVAVLTRAEGIVDATHGAPELLAEIRRILAWYAKRKPAR